MFERCLICTDIASDGLYRLAYFVPSLAAGGMKQIVFFHCTPLWEEGRIPKPDKKRMEEARQRLSPALENVPAGVDVRVEVGSGAIVDNILRVTAEYGSELLVIGTAERNLLTEKLFGSTAIELSQRARVPIMTIPGSILSAFTSEELDLRCRHLYRNLLIPYDGSEVSQFAIAKLKEYLQKHSKGSLERCMLCWIVESGGRRELEEYLHSQLETAQATLGQVKSELEAFGLQVDVEAKLGEPIPDTLELARMSDICAIAISSGSLGKVWRLPLPSFAAEVLRHSCEPVLFFPHS